LVGGEFGEARWSVCGVVCWGSGEVPVGLTGTDAVTLAGTPSFLKVTPGVPLLAPPRTRETLGPVRAATSLSLHIFFEVLLSMRRFRILERAQWGWVIFILVDPALLTLVPFCFISFGLACVKAQTVISRDCYINMVGRTPVTRRNGKNAKIFF
jgi:hypothetical protein